MGSVGGDVIRIRPATFRVPIHLPVALQIAIIAETLAVRPANKKGGWALAYITGQSRHDWRSSLSFFIQRTAPRMDPDYIRFYDSDSDSDCDYDFAEEKKEPEPINCEVAKERLVAWSSLLEGKPSNTLWQAFNDWVTGAVRHGELRITVPAPPPMIPPDYPTKTTNYEAKCMNPVHRVYGNDRFCAPHDYMKWNYVFTPDPNHHRCQIHRVEPL